MQKLVMYEDNRLVWVVTDRYSEGEEVATCDSDVDDEFIQSVDYMHGLLRRAEGVPAEED